MLTIANPPYYSIPPDNPYISNPNVLDEIWALGLRNPWRWSFDKATGDMWIADVGQGSREEVNFRATGSTGGINYGWRCFEGFISTPGVPDCTPANYVPPIFDYSHGVPEGGISITGGYVYRGTEFPNLVGYYITGDWNSGNVWLILPNGTNTRQGGMPTSLTTFGEAEDGTIYAAAGGTVYKVTAVQAPTPVKLISFTLRQSPNFNDIYWKTASEFNVSRFSIQSSSDGINFTETGAVAASQKANGASYSFRHFTVNDKKLYYRLNTIDNDGTNEYSKVISTTFKNDADPIKIYPSTGSSILVELNTAFHSIRITNVYGQVIHRQLTGNATGLIYINTANLKKGIYILTAENAGGTISRKFLHQDD